MRFLLFDRVTRFEPGNRIEGVKSLSISEEYLRGHFDRRALVPSSLIIEAMVQLLGWLAIHRHDYTLMVVLSVLEDVEVVPEIGPGRTLTLFGELRGTNPKGSIGHAWAEVDGVEVARIGRVLYGHLPHPEPDVLRKRFAYYGGVLGA